MSGELIEQLASAVADGIEPGLTQDGILQLYLDRGEGGILAWHLIVDGARVDSGPGEHPDATAAMCLDDRWLAALCRGAVNLRDAVLASELQLAGDLGFMQEIVSACSRPSELTRDAFRVAEAKSRRERDHSVTRMRDPSPEDVVEQVRTCLPCVFEGLLDWPAMRWRFGDIRARYGNEIFRPDGDGGEPLSVLIDRVERGDRVYSYGCAVPDAMRDEFVFPVFPETDLSPKQLWLGTASDEPVTGLHRDARPVLLAQVIGRKRLVMYPAHQADALYPRRSHNDYYQQCWVDPEAPDLVRFPRFPEAMPLDVVLGPGDLLYIPTGWFHYVFAVDDVLSVSTILSSGALRDDTARIEAAA